MTCFLAHSSRVCPQQRGLRNSCPPSAASSNCPATNHGQTSAPARFADASDGAAYYLIRLILGDSATAFRVLTRIRWGPTISTTDAESSENWERETPAAVRPELFANRRNYLALAR